MNTPEPTNEPSNADTSKSPREFFEDVRKLHSPQANGDTQRTGNRVFLGRNSDDGEIVVSADFARTLERELTAVQSDIATLRIRFAAFEGGQSDLRSELTALRDENEALCQANKVYENDEPKLRHALTALEADKRRLDWLMNWNVSGHPFKTRAAIDAARGGAE